MKIKEIHIDTFGPHKNWSFAPKTEGVQFIYGPNESGKTSLLEAIRSLLFGGRTRPYDLVEGFLRLERGGHNFYIGRKGKSLDFHQEGGDVLTVEPSTLWWHGLDKKTYSRIFSLTLADLQGTDVLSEIDVRTRFFGAEGGETISDVVKDIEKSTQELLVASATGKRKINVLLEQLQENQEKIGALSNQEEEYVGYKETLAHQDVLEQDLQERLGERRDYRDGLDLVLRAWDTYQRAEEAKQHMEELRDDVEYDREEFTKLEQAIDQCREHMRIWRGKEEALLPDNFDPHHPMGHYGQTIESLYGQVGQWEQWLKEYEQGKQYIEALENQLDTWKRTASAWRGHEDWARDIDWGRGESLATEFVAARQARDEDQRAVEGERITQSEERQRFQQQQEAQKEAHRAKQKEINVAKKELKSQAKGIKQELNDLRYDSSQSLYIGFGIGFIVLAVILIVLGSMVASLALYISGMISLTLSLIFGLYGFYGRRRRLHRVRDLQEDLDEIEESLQHILAESPDTVASAEAAAIDAAGKVRLEGLEDHLAITSDRFEAAKVAWQAWLPQGANRSLEGSDFPVLKEEYRNYEDQCRHIADSKRQVAAHYEQIGALEERVKDLFRSIDYLGDIKPVELRKVYTLWQRFQQNRIRWEQKESQRQSYRDEYRSWERKERELLFAQQEMLTRYGLTSASELRQKLLNEDQYKQWETVYEQSMVHIRLLAPDGESESLFFRRLRNQDKASLEEELARNQELVAQLEEELNNLYERKGRLIESMRALADDEALSQALQERAQLEGELDQALEDWTTQVFINHCMEEAQGQYEADKQPKMLNRASQYVHLLTDGLYTLDVSSDYEVFAVDKVGRRLPTQQWSSGLGDQVYLAVRLSLAETFGETVESLPIVLDDILVRFDADRQNKALHLLADVAKRHQVWVLSCQKELADMARNIRGIDVYQMESEGLSPMGTC